MTFILKVITKFNNITINSSCQSIKSQTKQNLNYKWPKPNWQTSILKILILSDYKVQINKYSLENLAHLVKDWYSFHELQENPFTFSLDKLGPRKATPGPASSQELILFRENLSSWPQTDLEDWALFPFPGKVRHHLATPLSLGLFRPRHKSALNVPRTLMDIRGMLGYKKLGILPQ